MTVLVLMSAQADPSAACSRPVREADPLLLHVVIRHGDDSDASSNPQCFAETNAGPFTGPQ